MIQGARQVNKQGGEITPLPFSPPCSIEAEQSTLGAMMIEREAIDKVSPILGVKDFYRDAHKIIYDVLLTLAGRDEPADLVTVQEELKARDKLSEVGGRTYLTALFDTVPTAANVEHYARIVAEKAGRRHLSEFCLMLESQARADDGDLTMLLGKADRMLARVKEHAGANGTARPSAKRKPVAERIVDLADVQPPTDLPLLFGQYLLKGAAHWLTGATGLGKSTLLFNIAAALAEGAPLWDIECEQTRILYCDMESGDVGRAHKIERLYHDSPRVRGQLLFLREPIRLPDELDELLTYVQAKGISLVIFDTARRCFSVKDENDNAEVYNRVIPTLDALKQAGVATLTLGHPSKNGNGSARGAGAQEDAGDVNLSLTMHNGADVSDPNGVIALRVTKNRLLGLGIPPLLLRRVGNDQFEPLDPAGISADQEPTSKLMLCRQVILDVLRDADAPLNYGHLLEAATRAGFGKTAFDRTLRRMKEEKDLDPVSNGYTLHDPFAD